MPEAARVTDDHSCPRFPEGPKVHPILPEGEPTVKIGFLPAAREGDFLQCEGDIDTILKGEPTVKIGGKPAARKGDPTKHGGKITGGHPKVRIGSTTQGAALMKAGAPLVKPCEKLPPGGGISV